MDGNYKHIKKIKVKEKFATDTACDLRLKNLQDSLNVRKDILFTNPARMKTNALVTILYVIGHSQKKKIHICALSGEQYSFLEGHHKEKLKVNAVCQLAAKK